MKRYIISAIMAMILAFAGFAQDNSYALQVNTKDGKTVKYEFGYNPVATFDGDDMVITDDLTGISTHYNMAEIENLTILKPATAVAEIAAPDFIVKISRENISVAGLRAGDRVSVVNVSGATVASAVAEQDGSINIAIDSLGSGVFVVSMPGNSFKFIR